MTTIEEAVHVLRESLEATPGEQIDRPSRLTNLGLGLRDRYQWTGFLGDLQEAIGLFRDAARLTSDDSPALPTYLNNLGLGLSAEYDRTWLPEDLNAAIRAQERCVRLTPEAFPSRPMFLNNLGSMFWKRYDRSQLEPDLDQAIQLFGEALTKASASSPDRPMFLNNLGVALAARFARFDSFADLQEAIRAFRKAIELAPPGTSIPPRYWANLGSSLRDLHKKSGDLHSLDEATEAYRRAVAGAPRESPDRPEYLLSLGDSLRVTGVPAEAIQRYDEALSVLDGSLLQSPIAYQLGQQNRWEKLVANAVEAYLDSGSPAQAMTVAEGHKSRILTGILGRGGLLAPPCIPRDLSETEATWARRLSDQDALALSEYRRAQGADMAQRSVARLAILNQLKPIWAEMEAFGPTAVRYVKLRRGDRITWEELTELVASGEPDAAWISLFATGGRSVLFVLRPGWPRPEAIDLSLDETGWKELMDGFTRQVNPERYVGSPETWHERLRPGLEQAKAYLEGAKLVVFVPDADGHLLPWGALLSLVASIPVVTIPSLSLVGSLQGRSGALRSEALVVGDPLGDLPHAEAEAREVAALLGTRALIGAEARREVVVERLATAGVAHFATHAYFNESSPLDSSIAVVDGAISARDLLASRAPVPQFLALSGCQTANSGTLGGNEVLGLAHAFLYAGATSMLASLWSVNDLATASLMSSFYRNWLGNGTSKAIALMNAMNTTKSRLHWAQTYYWGAFTLLGDWR